MKNEKGLTLIELVVVILVIGLMFAIIIPIIQNVIQTSKAQKLETSFESLSRYIQTNTVLSDGSVQYTLINGVISPDIDYTGEMEGSGTITVDTDGNVELQIQAGENRKNEYCVYKSPQASKVKVQKGRCDELSLLDYDLILIRGLVTNHSITVFTQFSGGATEYYYQINGGEWLSNSVLNTSTYTFEGLNHNTAYELRAKVKTKEGKEAVSQPLLITTVDVNTPIINYNSKGREKIAYINFTKINPNFTYRYKVDNGGWITTTEALTNIRLNKNNTSFTAEVLDSEGNSMTSVNKIIDYKKDTKEILLTTRNQANGSVTDKYFNINYQARDEYFTYRYKVDNGSYIMPTEVKLETLITKNNSTILVEVVDPAGEVMRTKTLTSAYMDDTCYAITLSGTGTGGKVASNRSCAKIGDSVTITTTPSTGYHLSALTYNDGTSHDIASAKKFTMPRRTVTVAATWAKTPYTVTVTNTTGGTFKVSKTTAYYGDEITITPTAATGYQLSTLKYNDGSDHDVKSAKKFTMPAKNVTVTGTWSKIPYTITVTNTTGGTFKVSKTTAYYGDAITITTTASTGYQLSTLKYNDGSDHDVKSAKKFTMPAKNVTVTGTWSKIQYTVTVTNTTGGTFTVNKTKAYYGDSITVSASASTGYQLSTITYNGNNITSAKKFTMPAGNVTVTGTWSKIPYTVTVVNTTGGTFGVSKTTAYYGDTITVSASPAANYALSSITYNGNNITSTRSFTMPAGNVTVTGSWYVTTVWKYRTRSWVSNTCGSAGYTDWQCCGTAVNYACACCTGANSTNCGPQGGASSSCCGHYWKDNRYDCSDWGSWGSWTTTPCYASDGSCESKLCYASSPSGGCNPA